MELKARFHQQCLELIDAVYYVDLAPIRIGYTSLFKGNNSISRFNTGNFSVHYNGLDGAFTITPQTIRVVHMYKDELSKEFDYMSPECEDDMFMLSTLWDYGDFKLQDLLKLQDIYRRLSGAT